jgi:hypothetical protein
MPHQGRKKYRPTDEQRRQVLTMTGFGIPQDEIATLIKCDAKTLRKYFRRELDTGATEANLRVAQSLYNLAVRDRNVAACIWWTRARMGWRGTTNVDVGGQQDNPVAIDFRWAPALPQSPLAADPPTIDAEDAGGEDAETPGGALTVSWNTGSS